MQFTGEYSMPHSSGGGSHGGGSHSGSFSSSHSSGGGNLSAFRNRYFPGAKHRYVYYRRNVPHYVYSNYDLDDFHRSAKGQIFGCIFMILFMIPFIVTPLMSIVPVIAVSKPIKLDYGDTSVVIEDNIGVIDDERELKKTLKDFRDKTGITPCIVTVKTEEWAANYSTLENYAYDYYVNTFDDECHWLFIYSEPTSASSSSSGFNNWQWEGMQGNDTDNILTENKVGDFNEEVQKLLTDNDVGVGEAFNTSFEDLNETVMNFDSNIIPMVIFFVVWYGIIGYVIFGMIKGLPAILHAANAVEVDMAKNKQEAKQMEICFNYCGGIYVRSQTGNICPHCGAPASSSIALDQMESVKRPDDSRKSSYDNDPELKSSGDRIKNLFRRFKSDNNDDM